MKKIILIFAVVLVLAFSALPCFAVEYSTEFPSYVPISGGAFFEVESTFGKITFICANNYKTIISVLVVAVIIYVTLLILRSQGISIPLPEKVIRHVLPPLGRSNIERILQAITSIGI